MLPNDSLEEERLKNKLRLKNKSKNQRPHLKSSPKMISQIMNLS
jgi:hypothetical protein